MSNYILDRTQFWSGKKVDQEKRDVRYWVTKTPEERLRAAWYLTCRAYNIDPNNPPKFDKTAFRASKRND